MEIYKKLLKIQGDLKAPKSQYNSFGKYNYRNCEDILEALKPLLTDVKATLFITDEIVNVEGRFYVKATVKFVDVETGDIIENSALAREEESKKGMDGSQVTGASSSYARKYALNGMFAIDDTKDSDYTNQNENKSNSKADNGLISEPQVKRLYALGKGKDVNAIKDILKHYNFADAKKVTKDKYNVICEEIEKL